MYLSLLALLYSGLVQALISPPLNWTVLHALSWLPAFWVFSGLSGRRAFLAGWLVGTSANLAIFYWLAQTVHSFLGIPAPLAPAVLLLFSAGTGLYVAVFAWGFQRIRRTAGRVWPLAIAAWFCALEFVAPQLFTYYQGVAWYQLPQVFLITSLTGVSGMSFLVMLCNGVAWQGVESLRAGVAQRQAFFANAGVLLLLLLSTLAYSTQRLAEIERAEADTKPLEIALIQPNYTIERRRELLRKPPGAFVRDLVTLSREVARRTPGRIDVYVWPEGALPQPPGEARNLAILDFARESGAEIWTGANFQKSSLEGLGVHHNSAFRIDESGGIDRRYDKTILVPFGEYVPLKGVLPGLDRIKLPGDFEAGGGLNIYSSGLAKFAFLICYEAIKSSYVRTGIQRGAELLVNVSGDARSGDHSEQSQHLMLVSIQSAQFGVPLVRSATTGISAFVDARGLITAQTSAFERGGLVRTVRPMRIHSVYAHYGDWFAWACVAISAMFLAVADEARPTKPATLPLNRKSCRSWLRVREATHRNRGGLLLSRSRILG